MIYIVENTKTETRTSHKGWQAAFKAAAKQNPDDVIIRERDRDGERVYNVDGNILWRD